MSLTFQKSGFLTTIQDLGRKGFRRFGINPNGAMDQTAARLINILLGNDENEAVFEMHFPAPVILFDSPVTFALGGADFGAVLNDEKIENWRLYFAEKGDLLQFSDKLTGRCCYLSVRGGFQIEKWLESASTNLVAKIGGWQGRQLQKGDKLFFRQNPPRKNLFGKFKISNSLIPLYSKFPTVRFVEGGEFEQLTAFSYETFYKENFVISSSSDRMGFRLTGKPLYLMNEFQMVSSAVNFGTIQLLPDGQLIVLMADHQTSGGYPRLANVIPTDLPLLAQLGANDRIAFHPVSLEEAENLLIEFEKDLKLLKISCRFQNGF